MSEVLFADPQKVAVVERLRGRVALVTGASRGVGKGIALELVAAGATVYITGRDVKAMEYLAGRGTALVCDHRDDRQVEIALRRIDEEQNRIDILVNNVWGGYENMVEAGEFTWTRPFWRQPLWRWEAMFQAGVRAHYVTSRWAAAKMTVQRSGLIVSISFWSAQKHIGNVAYGVAKAATDKMVVDMAEELREYSVAAVSLYPGLVRTEGVMAASAWLDLSNSESPQFIGRAVVELAADPQIMAKSGKVMVAASLAMEHGFSDVDGKQPRPLTVHEV